MSALITTRQEGVLITDPSAIRDFVTPEQLAVPGNFYMTESLNMLEDGLVKLPDGRLRQIEDNEAHPLGQILTTSVEGFEPRESSFFTVQGDPYTEGAAFGVMVGELEDLKQLEDGPLVRAHSACAYSEVGTRLANLLYSNPAWLLDNLDELHPAFIKHGDGIAMAYPNLEVPERSVDCDCRAQRILAQMVIAAAGGFSFSLAGKPQEGRGYGREMKERMYWVQRKYGYNTVETARYLGITPDIRRYDHLGKFLSGVLGLEEIRFLSNNPFKVAELSKYLRVNKVSLMPSNVSEEARKYVASKSFFGHEIDSMTNFSFEMGMLQMMPATSYSTADISVLNEKIYAQYRF